MTKVYDEVFEEVKIAPHTLYSNKEGAFTSNNLYVYTAASSTATAQINLLSALKGNSLYLCLFGSPYSLKNFEEQTIIAFVTVKNPVTKAVSVLDKMIDDIKKGRKNNKKDVKRTLYSKEKRKEFYYVVYIIV